MGRMVRLTPNGLSVRSRQRAISLVRSSGVGCVSAVIRPSAPALATAATSSARPTHCMPPWTIGCSTPTSSVNRVLIMMGPLFPRRGRPRASFSGFRGAGCRQPPQKSTGRGGGRGNAIMQKRGSCFRRMDNSAWRPAFPRSPANRTCCRHAQSALMTRTGHAFRAVFRLGNASDWLLSTPVSMLTLTPVPCSSGELPTKRRMLCSNVQLRQHLLLPHFQVCCWLQRCHPPRGRPKSNCSAQSLFGSYSRSPAAIREVVGAQGQGWLRYTWRHHETFYRGRSR